MGEKWNVKYITQEIKWGVKLPNAIFTGLCLLSISTSERVLRTPFAGRNQIFKAKTTFYVLFSE